jgi:hypothetical protein
MTLAELLEKYDYRKHALTTACDLSLAGWEEACKQLHSINECGFTAKLCVSSRDFSIAYDLQLLNFGKNEGPPSPEWMCILTVETHDGPEDAWALLAWPHAIVSDSPHA